MHFFTVTGKRKKTNSRERLTGEIQNREDAGIVKQKTGRMKNVDVREI